MAFVYILKSLKDNKQYIGSTINLKERLEKHNNGYVCSTKHRRPLILKAYQCFENIKEAVIFEKKYKRSHDILDRAIKAGKFMFVNSGA